MAGKRIRPLNRQRADRQHLTGASSMVPIAALDAFGGRDVTLRAPNSLLHMLITVPPDTGEPRDFRHDLFWRLNVRPNRRHPPHQMKKMGD